jgi:leucyl aminopeptidase
MNTKVTVSNAYKSKDDLIILSDINDFNWTSSLLTDSETAFLKNAAKKEASCILLPRSNNSIIVQFLKENGTDSISREDARIAGNDVLTVLSQYKIKSVTLVNKRSINRTLDFLEGVVLGNYQFLKYYGDKKDKINSLQEVKIDKSSASRAEVIQIKNVLEATCKARDLVNEPHSFLSAEQMSKEIQSLGKACGFSVKIFDKKKIESLKMGGIIAVNLGSENPPRFNILEWKPKKAKNKKPIVLVGKGIVYDTGGLSLKPTANSMDFMKSDMGGAATVIGTMMAVASNNLPLHIVALIPSTDNRPGKNAYAPGDVITMYDGTTVEVLNTDAEGRLVLADALHYAKKYKPELVLDFATLTGAAARAVGREAICFMGTADKNTKEKFEKSAFDVYERLVEFPLWREYGDQLKSNIADLKNLGGPNAGMITAGKFLEHFTDYPWLHFDTAGSAYLHAADSYRTKEGTGVGVRLMFDFLKNY